jgi:hypothetical protein
MYELPEILCRLFAFVSIDDNNKMKMIGDDKQTVRCLFVELAHDDDDELVYVCMCALVLRFSSSSSSFSSFFFLALKEKDDDAVLEAQKRPDGREFLFIYIYFSKKEKREMLVADDEATLSTVAFVLSTHPMMPRFSLTSTLFFLVLFSSTRFSFSLSFFFSLLE